MVLHSLEVFLKHPETLEIIVVCAPEFQNLFPKDNLIRFASPGKRRQDSTFNGFQQISKQAELVCIHDGARPYLTRQDLDSVLAAAKMHGAATLGSPVKNTIKEATAEGKIARTIERASLWEVYTPQVATPELLKRGFAIARASDFEATDDNSIVALTEHPIHLVVGSSYNIKITTYEDLKRAEEGTHAQV